MDPFQGASTVAIRRIGHHGPAVFRERPAAQEINAGLAEASIRDVTRHDILPLCFDDAGHRAVAAARLPHRAAQRHAAQQSFGNPGGRGIKVVLLTIIAGNMYRVSVAVSGAWTRISQCHGVWFLSAQVGNDSGRGGSLAGIVPSREDPAIGWRGFEGNTGVSPRTGSEIPPVGNTTTPECVI